MEDSLYKEMILDLYRNPLNKKVIVEATYRMKELNPSCGDEIEIMIQCDEQGNILDIGHQGQGCAISQAAVSLLTEEVKGKNKKYAEQITEEQVMAMLQIPISHTRTTCATLGLKAMKQCISHTESYADPT